MTTQIRIVIGVVGDTDTTALTQSVDAAREALRSGDELVLLAERADVEALDVVARQMARPSSGLGSASVRLVTVADLGAPGVLSAVATADASAAEVFVAMVDPGVRLLPTALDDLRIGIDADASVDMVYGDSFAMATPPDSIRRSEQTVELRPGWSPDRLRTNLYLGPVVAYRASVITDLNPTSAHDLALLASERVRAVAHVPAVLAEAPPDIGSALVDVDAVRRSLDRQQLAMTVDATLASSHRAVLAPAISDPASVSIVILTAGATREVGGRTVLLVANAIASILVSSPDANVEIIVVVGAETPDELARQLKALDPSRIWIVKDERPFNFSERNNAGVQVAAGDLLVFFNDDAEVMTADWLDRIRMHLADPGIGVVGARLLFGDGRVQHAGLVVRNGWVEHRFGGYRNDDSTRPAPLENVSAVTGAVLAMTRAHFDELGGFPEEFPLNFNDVDLCFASRASGRRVVLDHNLVLLHHETSSRKAGIADDEQARFVEKWTERGFGDPYDHPGYLPVRAEPLAPPAALSRLRRTLHGPAAPRVIRVR